MVKTNQQKKVQLIVAISQVTASDHFMSKVKADNTVKT